MPEPPIDRKTMEDEAIVELLSLGDVSLSYSPAPADHLRIYVESSGLAVDLENIVRAAAEVIIYADKLIIDGGCGHPSHVTLRLSSECQAYDALVWFEAAGFSCLVKLERLRQRHRKINEPTSSQN